MDKRTFLKTASAAGLASMLPGTVRAQFKIPNIFGNQQSKALNLGRAAASGSPGAAAELKRGANAGDRWSAMQYGFLCHTGQNPLLRMVDIPTAIKAYSLACKIVGSDQQIISLSGNNIAAYNMGLIYLSGKSPDAINNAGSAIQWFNAASGDEGGTNFYPAHVQLGLLFDGAKGVPADLVQARTHWKAASAAREPIGMYKWAKAQIEGIGASANYFEGFIVLNQAADQWSTEAMYMLAQIYANGTRLHEKNNVEAARWLLIASVKAPSYVPMSDALLATMPALEQRRARDLSIQWMRAHAKTPEPFDYTKPINDDPPKRGM